MQGPGKTFNTSVDWEEIDRRLSEDPAALMADLGGVKQEKDDGGSAFPFFDERMMNTPEYGMTLRDYFAAKAMQSLIDVFAREAPEVSPATTMKFMSAKAYQVADAMLMERAK